MKSAMAVGSFILFLAAANAWAQSSTITTFAGPLLPVSGTQALSQAIDFPSAVAADGSGGFYVASSAQSRIYKVASNGTLTIAAGTSYGFGGDGGQAVLAQLATPSGLALDSSGNLYVADTGNNRVRKVTANGVITTIAGVGTSGFSGDGGPATSAEFASPNGVAIDGAGNVYVADGGNRRVRKVSPDGTISTFAGSGSKGEGGNGAAATSAQLETPYGLAADAAGNLYIADGFAVRRVSAGIISNIVNSELEGRFGQICTFSGDGGPAFAASVCQPSGLALDQAGNLYITDRGNQRIRRVTTDGIIQTVAGNGNIRFSGDAGPAMSASLGNPSNVSVDAQGNLYIADTTNSRVRKVTPDGVIHTIAGNGTAGFAGDGGQAVSALFSGVYASGPSARGPSAVASDRAGNVYIADTSNNRVRKVTGDGMIRTIAGTGAPGSSGDGGPAILAALDRPTDVVVDKDDNVYIAVTGAVRKMTPDGVIRTIAGQGGTGCITPSAILCIAPRGLAVDSLGALYIADGTRVRKVAADGVISTLAGNGSAGFSGDGGPAASAQLIDAYGVAVDANGTLYISDVGNHRIRKVTANGVITTVAGTGAAGFSGDGGPALNAQLSFPEGIAVDALGSLYIADNGDSRIRKITSDGVISTIAGNGTPGFSGDGGTASSAQLDEPADVTVDIAGNVYIADSLNSRIRRAEFVTSTQPYTIANSGASYWSATSTSPSLAVGSGSIQPAPGTPASNGVAIITYRSNGVLVSEAAVPASPPIQAGRIYAESSGAVRTGVAMANPNDQSATISFYFTDQNGVNFRTGSTTLGSHQQLSAFLDEAPFLGNAGARTFSFTSSQPVGVIALRGHLNERGDFLMTTLPVAPIGAASNAAITLPHYAIGGGWWTQFLLVNSTDQTISGTVDMEGLIPYSIAPRSADKIPGGLLSRPSESVHTGMVRITPAANSQAPIVSSLFTFTSGGITVTETGVATTEAAQSFRMFAEIDAAHAMQSGIALGNTAAAAAAIQFELLDLSGQPTGYSGSTSVNGGGHLALFLSEIPGFQNLPRSFRGVLRLTSTTPVSAIGLRERYNERGDFLISATPAIPDTTSPSAGLAIFPQVVAGGGYTTEFILMGPGGTLGNLPLTGSVLFTSQAGTELRLQLLK